jgi:dienelactone hydrolase
MERPFPAYDGEDSYVFVCYAHGDADVVYPEMQWLRDNGVNVWYDEGITPGEEFPERLGNAILGASLVLFYVSPRSVDSRHCRNEVFFSLDRNTPVLALHIEKTELPPGLALSTGTVQAIMRHEMGQAEYRRKLMAGIQELTGDDATIEISPELLGPPSVVDRLKPYAKLAAAAAAIALLALLGVQVKGYLEHQEQLRWARDEAMPKIREMMQTMWRDFSEPYALAVQAEAIIPDDPELAQIMDSISLRIDVESDPSGATAYYKNYNTPEAEWKPLGTTPIRQVRLPVGIFRWKFELAGHATVLAAASSWDINVASGSDLLKPSNLFRRLDRIDDLPPGMVRVQGAETPQGFIGDFFIDRFEVSNAQFEEFVDAGGYSKPEYWQEKFVAEGQVLSWEEAMSRFVDTTGRPGPSSWVGGHHPERLENHPVSGVSWYEADAYAHFVGKELPTEVHWGLARGEYLPLINWPQLGGFSTFAPFSNIGGNGTIEVGSLPGFTAYGAYDMAGNVREWCQNDSSLGKLVRGGAWDDNPYAFGELKQAPPMMRQPGHGFRTMQFISRESVPTSAFRVVPTNPTVDYAAYEPVSDEVFEVYLNQFAYDRGALGLQPISVDDGHPDWTLERVSVATPYGDERMIINLFLPKKAAPPFQTVIYFPGGASLFQDSSENLSEYYEVPVFLSFLIRNGRAVVYPVYQGTFERHGERYYALSEGNSTHAHTEYIVQLVKDFRRTVDYLETRSDIDAEKLAYYGMSWGGIMGAMIPAVEDRLNTAIILAGGLDDVGLPEVKMVNYVPRITIPVLMMNGKYDTIIGYENSARPMFQLLGTPEEHKKIEAFPTDHIPPKPEYVREILDWLDRYFGPVTGSRK